MNAGFINEAQLSVVDIGTCDVKRGGCGGLVVVDVKEVIVTLRTRRVEGEGAAEDGGVDEKQWTPAMLASTKAHFEHFERHRKPLQVDTATYGPPLSPVTVEDVIAETNGHQAQEISAGAKATLGPEPVVEPYPDAAPTLAELPDEVVEQLADDVAEAILMPKSALQVETNGHGTIAGRALFDMRILAAPVGLTALVDGLLAGTSFTTLAKASRLRLISIFGEALAVYCKGAPTMGQWNEHRPLWMPNANSIAQTYDEGSLGWKGMAQEWAEVALKAVHA